MPMRRTGIALFAFVTLATTAGLTRHARSSDVTVHEWGTFTTVAGVDGRAIDWLPLGGPTDLPCFVKHIRHVGNIPKVAPNLAPGVPLTYETARRGLWGKVRMETPVIYFYSANEHQASVTVDFPRGVITEFYPTPVNSAASFSTITLTDPNHVHSMQWYVKVSPGIPELYPNGGGESHYYAARATDATPLKVGVETEKFIFYRGVASFDVPIQTRVLANGDVELWNLGELGPLPAAILFESRNGKVGYRLAGELSRADTLSPPELSPNVDAVREELRKELVRAGLFPKEAQAMLDTWRDSWFEEGTRVFYVLPARAIDAILPLKIHPAPTRTARVFVGRMEVIDRTTVDVVKAALASNDAATLQRYGRFLSPITDRIIDGGTDSTTNARIAATARAAFAKYAKDLRVCD